MPAPTMPPLVPPEVALQDTAICRIAARLFRAQALAQHLWLQCT